MKQQPKCQCGHPKGDHSPRLMNGVCTHYTNGEMCPCMKYEPKVKAA